MQSFKFQSKYHSLFSKLFNFRIIFSFLVIFGFPSRAFAQETKIQDKLIGSTFRTLAKAFIAVKNIDELKEYCIRKIDDTNEDKFKSKYNEAYEIVKELPSHIKVQYGISEQMDKKQAVTNVKSLNKKKIYEIIDSISDEIISEQFKKYIAKKKQEIKNSSIAQNINEFLKKIIGYNCL